MKRLLAIVLVLLVSGHAWSAVILQEDFEAGAPPAGWSRSQLVPSVGWEFGTNLGSFYFPVSEHTRYAASNDDAHDNTNALQNNAAEDRLISPALNLSGQSGQALRLRLAYVQPGNYGSTGFVEASVNGNAFVQIAQLPKAEQWTNASISLSAYAGFSNVRIAFRHNDGGGWSDGFAIDDVVIESLVAHDAAMEGIGGPGYLAIGANFVEGRISNQGGADIISVGFDYRVANGPIQSSSRTLPSPLQTGDEVDLSLFQYEFPTAGEYAVEITVTSVNGLPDENPGNDVVQGVTRVLSEVPEKRVIIEQHTGAWCGYCPDSTFKLEEMQQLYPNVIGASVHNGDAMVTPEGAQLQTAFISGYPTGTIDRARPKFAPGIAVNRDQWALGVAERLEVLVPADVQLIDVSYDAYTRQVTATVGTSFFGNADGDYRLNLWVLEDHVIGVGSGYDQANYYDTAFGHPYYGAGNSIVGFTHDRVVRAMVGGAWGTAGVIPPNVSDGQSYARTYQYTLPQGQLADHIRLIGVLSRYGAELDEREIVNATQEFLIVERFASGFE